MRRLLLLGTLGAITLLPAAAGTIKPYGDPSPGNLPDSDVSVEAAGAEFGSPGPNESEDRFGGNLGSSFGSLSFFIPVPPDEDTNPIPEPSTIALLGAGLAGVLLLRRHRRAK